MKVCANDQTDPFKLNCSISRSFIDCTLTQDASVLELRFPDSLIGHFDLTISLHAIDVVRPEVTTVTVNTEELVMDPSRNKDGKHCAKEFIHQLDHRIEADPRLELIKNFAEPPPDYDHVFTELREIMAIIRKVSVTKPQVAQELITAITQMLNITPKQLDAFSAELSTVIMAKSENFVAEGDMS